MATVGFAVARFTLPVSGLDSRDMFKDLAHIWVGCLLGAAVFAPSYNQDRSDYPNDAGDRKILLWILFCGLTLAEVVAFLFRGQT